MRANATLIGEFAHYSAVAKNAHASRRHTSHLDLAYAKAIQCSRMAVVRIAEQ
jgi:hypothetical protein